MRLRSPEMYTAHVLSMTRLIVVSGNAKVYLDVQEQYLTENESFHIPITAVHALENPGKVDLELIEVQSGSYLGEDDIVRFEDRYGRS